MKRILMVAYHFPPLAGSSGIQRTLRFAKYLPEFGWEPIILTAHPCAYERTSLDLLAEIPENIPVFRAPAFDAARHFAIRGRYFGFLARPDRWVSWVPGATFMGLSLIQRYRPDVLWSTYPIASAHQIAGLLHRVTKIPWVADFRDPMAQDGYPSDPRVWRSFRRIEERAIARARLSIFTTPGAVSTYAERYPESRSRMHLVENGYDEDSFTGLKASATPLNPGRVTLLHSGIVYPSERDPRCFLQAIRRLLDSGKLHAADFCVRFRAPGNATFLSELVQRFHVQDCIELLPPVDYQTAICEMLDADILLILQASNCNSQIPAKLYEYLRAGRPILALTDPVGDTAAVLREARIETIEPLDDTNRIADRLFAMVKNVPAQSLPSSEIVRNYSRQHRTREFASLLNTMQRESG